MTDMQKLIIMARAKLASMIEEERKDLYEEQRKSWLRGMQPCEHGVRDFEQCRECRKDEPMTDIQELLKEMREGLDGVTSGEWITSNPHPRIWHIMDKYGNAICELFDGKDTAHIARCNTVNIKALLDYIEELEGDKMYLQESLATERERKIPEKTIQPGDTVLFTGHGVLNTRTDGPKDFIGILERLVKFTETSHYDNLEQIEIAANGGYMEEVGEFFEAAKITQAKKSAFEKVLTLSKEFFELPRQKA